MPAVVISWLVSSLAGTSVAAGGLSVTSWVCSIEISAPGSCMLAGSVVTSELSEKENIAIIILKN